MTEHAPKFTAKDITFATAILIAEFAKEGLARVAGNIKEFLRPSVLSHNHTDCISRTQRWFRN